MGCKYRCLIILLAINAIFGIGTAILWGTNGTINFEIGFFSFLLVIYSTYLSLQKKLKKELKETEIELEISSDNRSQEEMEQKKPKTRFNFSTLLLGMQLSMGILRIFAYVILVLAITILMGKNIFIVIPYILGIIISLMSVVGLKYLSDKHQNSL
ncbi:hypothetical protein [Helicobacter cappadocius]|uniref:Uncharacterized protein n=1 Tax=Helicobacter cappadocius TaxID=3063998 RepID=A0AA90TET4_9HELI|nr:MULTISPECIES: hypothetical protein [unclassified Helicobacter]MDO7252897.1 hypothetical protein [Helicobacter sp. faydin-H75]MDP2538940.1 hypothetical protein [Helicobacter sp. faydin-H76]